MTRWCSTIFITLYLSPLVALKRCLSHSKVVLGVTNKQSMLIVIHSFKMLSALPYYQVIDIYSANKTASYDLMQGLGNKLRSAPISMHGF